MKIYYLKFYPRIGKYIDNNIDKNSYGVWWNLRLILFYSILNFWYYTISTLFLRFL